MIIEKQTISIDITEEFERFLTNNSENFKTESNLEKLRKAFEFAADAQKDVFRYSGKPHISHNFEVAKIVVQEIGLGTKSAIAALLYDIPGKTDYNIEDISRYFGDKIAQIVSGLIKIKKGESYENNTEASTFREILLTVSDDIRVLFVKIASKLNNLRTIEFVSKAKQEKLISEILNIYAPLSHRLGLYDIKTEMEDICLKYTQPHIYKQIEDKLSSTETERHQFIERIKVPLIQILKNNNIDYVIESRSKSIYSIWKKMESKGVSFEEVYDLFAIRIIFKPKYNEKFEALYLGSLISDIYNVKTDRTRNWLDKGKDTGYRALHLTVMSNEGKWVEIQIRSENMHEAAEHGFAAHWKYKGIKEKKIAFDEKVNEILQTLSKSKKSGEDLLDKIKLNLLATEIYVFTPKGKIVDLPKGATALDFAFKIHTKIALKAIAAKINGQLSVLETVLTNADQIEIITSQNQTPQKEWFKQVVTNRSINALKSAFKEERKFSIDNGRLILDELLSKNKIAQRNEVIEKLSINFNYKNKKDLFFDISENKITPDEIIEIIDKEFAARKSKFWKIKTPFTKNNSENRNINKLLYESYEIANCCNPTPGDKVIAVKNRNSQKIIIHKENCPTVISEKGKGKIVIPVNWTSYTAVSILNEYEIEGTDKKGVVNKITNLIAKELTANINSLNLRTEDDKFYLNMTLYTKNRTAAERIKLDILKIQEVKIVRLNNY